MKKLFRFFSFHFFFTEKQNDNFAVICHWCHHIAFWIEKFTKKSKRNVVLRCDNNLILFNGIIRTFRPSFSLSHSLSFTQMHSWALGMSFFFKLFCQTHGMHYSLVADIGFFYLNIITYKRKLRLTIFII